MSQDLARSDDPLDDGSITARHRWYAGAWSAGAATLAIGAKTGTLVLILLTLATLIGVSWCRQRFDRFLRVVTRPAPPLLAASAFGVFAALTAMWARDPSSALISGFGLLAVLACGQVLKSALQMLTPNATVLSAGWLLIGFLIGSAVLLEELISNYGIFRWLLDHAGSLGMPTGSMLEWSDGNWLLTTVSIANWSVAGVNILMWPLLLIVFALAPVPVRAAACAGVFALFATITMVSDHQTSQLAFVAGSLVFAFAFWFTDLARRVMLFFCLVAILAAVPVSYVVGRHIDLKAATWAQDSLKERFKIWGNVSTRVQEAPVIGIGANNSSTEYTYTDLPADHQVVRHHPHDMLLQTWLELGAVGVGLLIGLVVLLFREMKTFDREAQVFALATLVVVFVESIATWNLWSRWFQAVVVLAVTLLWLGVSVRDDLASGTSARFGKIWLPKWLVHPRHSEA